MIKPGLAPAHTVGAKIKEASVVIVSRHRPAHLALCLRALCHQRYRRFEVVVVADPDSVGVCPDLPIKRVVFDRPNIAQARNLGLTQAAGVVVAFLDDDAIAEPGWLAALMAAFDNPDVIAAAGFTRGPDGIRFQARAEYVDRAGFAHPLPPVAASYPPPPEGGAISTIGTNCAFRRAALEQIGGFDPLFSYHLDETDVNLRLAAAFPRGLTAIVPEAEVIHGLAPGTFRGGAHVPLDLSMIGRSSVVLWRKQGVSAPDRRRFFAQLKEGQRRRLLRFMLAGDLDPFRLSKRLRSLEQGAQQGEAVSLTPMPSWPMEKAPAFCPFPVSDGRAEVLHGWHWQGQDLRAKARARAAAGPVTVMLWTPSFLPHRLRFHPDGFWEQRGGLWGPSLAGDGAVVPLRRAARLKREGTAILSRRGL